MADTERPEPTVGLRIELVTLPADRDQGDIARIQTKLTQHCADARQSTPAEWSQAGVDATHINDLLSAYDRRQEIAEVIGPSGAGEKVPTPGVRLYDLEGELVFVPGFKMVVLHTTARQRAVDIEYINWLIETDEQRRAHIAKQSAGSQELLVDLGDMTRATLDSIQMDAAYEEMTEDLIQTFNNIVLQGIPPIKAVFSLSQAFAIVLGFALRANMPFDLARNLITQVMNSATSAEKMVRIITK